MAASCSSPPPLPRKPVELNPPRVHSDIILFRPDMVDLMGQDVNHSIEMDVMMAERDTPRHTQGGARTRAGWEE